MNDLAKAYEFGKLFEELENLAIKYPGCVDIIRVEKLLQDEDLRDDLDLQIKMLRSVVEMVKIDSLGVKA